MDGDKHDSDCATHNEPAMPAAACDCTAREKAAYRNGVMAAHAKIGERVKRLEQEYAALPMNFWGGITRAHADKATEIRVLAWVRSDLLDAATADTAADIPRG